VTQAKTGLEWVTTLHYFERSRNLAILSPYERRHDHVDLPDELSSALTGDSDRSARRHVVGIHRMPLAAHALQTLFAHDEIIPSLSQDF